MLKLLLYKIMKQNKVFYEEFPVDSTLQENGNDNL